MKKPKGQYLRSPIFDHFFIWGVPLIATISVLIVIWRPALFDAIFLLDLSLLGYHHVIATFTRFRFSEDHQQQNRMLLFYLPPAVILAVFGLSYVGGIVLITTIYLHWQWWHYTRQSEGISKAYSGKLGAQLSGSAKLNRITFYLIPICSFLAMSARQPPTFLFAPVLTAPIPVWLAQGSMFIAALFLARWLWLQTKALLNGNLPALLYCYYLSHFFIYLFAYYFIENITIGWLLINIWHNLQYICFVWACNVNEFHSNKLSINTVRRWFCDPKRWLIYFAACYIVTECVYGSVNYLIVFLSVSSSLPLFLVFYQAINFHHYIVDTFIWKLRKKTVRDAVGI